jgi:hypothetical protein
MLIWEIALIFMMVGVGVTAFGYNLTLGGYSRRRLLEGESVESQAYNRRRVGKEIIKLGIIIMATAILAALALGIFTQVETKEIIPKELDIMVAQGKTVIIIDGYLHTVTGEHRNIKRVYSIGKINCYGFGFWETIIIEDKDQWER